MAAAGAAEENRELVADQLAAAVARYYWLMLAESHLTRRLFGSMVRRLAALPVLTG